MTGTAHPFPRAVVRAMSPQSAGAELLKIKCCVLEGHLASLCWLGVSRCFQMHRVLTHLEDLERMKRLGMKRLVPDALHPSLCGTLPFPASDGSLCGLGTGLRFNSCCSQISELPLNTSLTISLHPWLVNQGPRMSRGVTSADISALVQMQPLASQDPLDLGFV